MNHRYILKDGYAVQCPDLMEWADWMEAHRMETRKLDVIAGIAVSTVFLGLDHSFGRGDPVLWEMMTHNEDTGEWGDQHRFCFEGEAHAFHDAKVKELKKLLSRWPLHL